jgi:hypothetical protein
MKFEVPQFIEIEDKVFGPLTFKQFLYLAGGAGISIVIWIFVPKILGVLLIAGFIGLSVALAFYKFNEKPFVDLLESMSKFLISGRLYIWKKEHRKPDQKQESVPKDVGVIVPRLSDSKLRDLAWSLDVHDSLYSGMEETQ